MGQTAPVDEIELKSGTKEQFQLKISSITHSSVVKAHVVSIMRRNILTSISFVQSPTRNCQLFSIASFYNLLIHIEEDEEVICILKTLLRHFKHGKPLMFLDLKAKYIDRVTKLFSNINCSIKYTSTNGSDMVIFLINVASLYSTT